MCFGLVFKEVCVSVSNIFFGEATLEVATLLRTKHAPNLNEDTSVWPDGWSYGELRAMHVLGCSDWQTGLYLLWTNTPELLPNEYAVVHIIC